MLTGNSLPGGGGGGKHGVLTPVANWLSGHVRPLSPCRWRCCGPGLLPPAGAVACLRP